MIPEKVNDLINHNGSGPDSGQTCELSGNWAGSCAFAANNAMTCSIVKEGMSIYVVYLSRFI